MTKGGRTATFAPPPDARDIAKEEAGRFRERGLWFGLGVCHATWNPLPPGKRERNALLLLLLMMRSRAMWRALRRRYVKECKAELSYLAHMAVKTAPLRPETNCIVGELVGRRGGGVGKGSGRRVVGEGRGVVGFDGWPVAGRGREETGPSRPA